MDHKALVDHEMWSRHKISCSPQREYGGIYPKHYTLPLEIRRSHIEPSTFEPQKLVDVPYKLDIIVFFFSSYNLKDFIERFLDRRR